RRIILKRLKDFYDRDGSEDDTYLLLEPAADVVGKPLSVERGQKYFAAINQLRREGLILSRPSPYDDKSVFSFNPARKEDISKELSWLRNQAIIFVVPALIAIAGLVWAVVTFFLRK